MKKSEVTREKLIKVAEDIFAEKGFSGARVDEIAKISGVNKRMIYAHFTNKENLYKEVLNRVYGRMVEMENNQDMDLPADEVLRKIISGYFEYLNNTYPRANWRFNPHDEDTRDNIEILIKNLCIN